MPLTLAPVRAAPTSTSAPRACRGALSVRAAQSMTGKVVSTKQAATVVVEVDRFPPHPLYAKRIRYGVAGGRGRRGYLRARPGRVGVGFGVGWAGRGAPPSPQLPLEESQASVWPGSAPPRRRAASRPPTAAPPHAPARSLDKAARALTHTLSPRTHAHTRRSTTRYQAHDAEGLAGMGDIVRLAPVRPISKTKRFQVAEVIKKSD
jgi:ribosomal protein S17